MRRGRFDNSLKEAIKDLDKQLSELSSGIEGVELLRTIPGIGSIRAATFCAEIGNIKRFRSCEGLANNTGLTPSIRASGDTVHSGGITKMGSGSLRYALVEAAISVIRVSPSLNRLFNRVLHRGHVQKARVAVARKLAVIIYVMLKRRQPFKPEAAQAEKTTTN